MRAMLLRDIREDTESDVSRNYDATTMLPIEVLPRGGVCEDDKLTNRFGLSSLGLASNDEPLEEVANAPPFVVANPQRELFCLSRKWRGVVTSLSEDSFTADLTNLMAIRPTEDIQATFDQCDVSPDDRELVKLGAMFYWSLGTVSISGQIMRISKIAFRRMGRWSRDDERRTKRLVRSMSQWISEDSEG